MSWNHGTYGWGKYESFVKALQLQGISYTEELKAEKHSRGMDINCMCYCGYGPAGSAESCPCCKGTCDHVQHLRIAHFTVIPARKRKPRRMVVEEYLAIKDLDCDGASQVAIEVYEEGQRPDLEARLQVLEA